jgi:hypothetical protein
MATTTRGIPYPDDYTQAADIPAALENLAETVDDLVTAVDVKASGAQTAATTADSKAVAASSAVTAHTHDGATSANIAIAAVTGLTASLASKSGTDHTHSNYATATHQHTAQEIAAHTHTEYSVTAHTHTQAQSHTSPDTDVAPGSLHHTLGTGANQAAAGNHTHSGYAPSTHTHEGYSVSTHLHTGTYSTEGHTHSEYAATAHNHDTAYAGASHNHEYAATSHNHANQGLALASLSVSGAAVDLPGVYGNNTTGLDNVGITAAGRLRRLSSSQLFKYDIATVSGVMSPAVHPARTCDVVTTSPEDVLSLAVAEFSIIDEGKATERRHLGFIADDVAAKMPIAATFYTDSTTAAGVLDTAILAALLHVIRDQQSRIEALEARLA